MKDQGCHDLASEYETKKVLFEGIGALGTKRVEHNYCLILQMRGE